VSAETASDSADESARADWLLEECHDQPSALDEHLDHRGAATPDRGRQLGLTPRQVSELDALFDGTLDERIRLRKAFDRLEADFTRLLSDDDAAKAIDLVPRVEAARAARNVARTMLLVRMYRVLTPHQRRVLGDSINRRLSNQLEFLPN
jgi:Spy/CpxP family protein refolding chaperone